MPFVTAGFFECITGEEDFWYLSILCGRLTPEEVSVEGARVTRLFKMRAIDREIEEEIRRIRWQGN